MENFDSTDAVIRPLDVPLIHAGSGTPVEVMQAHLQVIQSRAPLRILQRSVDSWFLWTAVAAGIAALMLATWLSSRISQPLVELAAKTAALDLDRLDVRFDRSTGEVGLLASRLGDLTSRLRTSTARVRDAERRATIGDLARQINHDIKNGLIPLRNVMRHLEQVERDAPAELASVFSERRHTMDSSIAYLETLATSYQRLSPSPSPRNCNLKALIEDVVRASRGRTNVVFTMDVDQNLPTVVGDPIALRRILENLIANAVDSLESNRGDVRVSAETMRRDSEPPWIRLVVADTGKGMTKEICGQIFNDFYTTKEKGTGLGLSIVRRLVMDLHGSITVESEPGKGTEMILDIPSGSLERT